VRAAQPSDHAAIVSLMGAFYREEGLPVHPRGEAALHALLADPSLGFALLAEAGGAVVGYVVVTFGFSLELGGRDAFIDELFVDHGHRRRGLGRALLRAALARARAEGAGQVLLEVAAPEPGKLALYAQEGFVRRPHPLMVCR
jgi:GNAT superfamily N-acetyltransferase